MVHPMTMVTIVMQQKTSADMPGLFLAFNIVADFNDSTTFRYDISYIPLKPVRVSSFFISYKYVYPVGIL